MSLPVCHDDSIAPNATCHMCDLLTGMPSVIYSVNISDGIDGINMRLKIKLGWRRYCWLVMFGRLEKELEQCDLITTVFPNEREVPNN